MTVVEESLKRMSTAYDQIVAVLDANELDRQLAFHLTAKITCQLFEGDRDAFIHHMEQFYSMERFSRPQPKGIH